MDKVGVFFKLPSSIYDKFRIRCIKEHKFQKDVLEEIVRKYIKKNKKK